MGTAITSLLLPCVEEKGRGSAGIRNGEETAAPVLYIDGTDIRHGLRFEFASPHCCPSPSEDSVINIVGGAVAPMNTKVLLAYSGGFASPSISKICTLHQYEIENMALLKLSLFFYQLSTLAKMLNSRLIYSVCLSLFLLVNDLLPASIWGLKKIAFLQHMMVAKWHPESESALFFPHHCLIQERHIIMDAQKPVPHTCANHAHTPEISCDDLPLLFLLFAKGAASKM